MTREDQVPLVWRGMFSCKSNLRVGDFIFGGKSEIVS